MAESMCWNQLREMLQQYHASDEAVEAARLAYSAGMHRGFFMLGTLTSTAEGMVKEWHELYPVAKQDFRDAKRKFKAARRKEGL